MTLVSDIIRDAYRETNIIALGTATSGLQDQEALTALNRFVKSVYDREIGERLQQIDVGLNNVTRKDDLIDYSLILAQSSVPSNSRLILNMTAPMTVYLASSPDDGARLALIDKSGNLSTYPLTIKGNGRTIENVSSMVYNVNSMSVEYMYSAEAGNWQKVSPLVSSDTWPFPTEFDDFFIISLAMRLNPRYQQQLDPQSQAVYKRNMISFKSRYKQTKEIFSERGIVALPSNPTGIIGLPNFTTS